MKTFPQWLKRPMPIKAIDRMNELLRAHNLHTVCQSARCPNIGECFKNKEATFMILGNICTRNCHFCSVKTGTPDTVDLDEPQRIAKAIKELGLEYIVVTSVTRDDLPDGGASHFAAVIKTIRLYSPDVKIEILTPDFNNSIDALNILIGAGPDCFAHNIETVPRLYSRIRPDANYNNSIFILNYVKNNSDILTKSGIIIGFGEKDEEILAVMKDLRRAGCDILTIGQYLRPSADCVDVEEFVEPERFEYYKSAAGNLGFSSVVSAPFARSSYRAKEAHEEVMGRHESSFA